MPEFTAPGVYVWEGNRGARPIEKIGMSTAAFIGVSPKPEAFVDQVRPINNWLEFRRAYVAEDSPATPLAQAVRGFFDNGGSRCYVYNAGPGNAIAGDARKGTGIAAFERFDEIRLVAAPGLTDPASQEAVVAHAEKMGERFAILDAPQEVETVEDLARGSEKASAEAAAGESGEGAARRSQRGFVYRPTKMGALYFPWIRGADFTGKIVDIPPSGHIAGIISRTDATRGVQKAPAGIDANIRGALDLTYHVTHAESGLLNSKGINCIRSFSGQGTCIWGARTMAPDPADRYVNVRRLLIMISESIQRGTNWIVFEPNDQKLWKTVTNTIRDFLLRLWRDGALMGDTPDKAFFVKCDAEVNTRETIDAGQLMTIIGIAPVKPAEFVCFEITRSMEGDLPAEDPSKGGA